MAKVKIQGHASGTGVFTVTAPNSNTDRTITLPDADVTLGTDATKLPLAGGTLTGDVNMLKTSGNSEFKVEASGTDAYATVRVKNDAKDYSMQIRSDQSDAWTIRDETAGANRLLISSTGDVTLGTGDLIFGTAGKGICLGVTTNTDSNTLDDYEEGTWTPVVKDDAGNTSPSITHNYSTYTKIGRMVTVTTELSSISSSGLSVTGDVRVYGLPFTVTTFGIGAVNMENVNYKDSYTDTESVTTITMDTFVYFRVNRNNGGSQGLEGGDINSGSSGFSFTVTYFV